MVLPGKIMTGLADRSGRRDGPDLHSACQACCSMLHMAAVSEGLVRVGVAMFALCEKLSCSVFVAQMCWTNAK